MLAAGHWITGHRLQWTGAIYGRMIFLLLPDSFLLLLGNCHMSFEGGECISFLIPHSSEFVSRPFAGQFNSHSYHDRGIPVMIMLSQANDCSKFQEFVQSVGYVQVPRFSCLGFSTD